MTYRQRLSRLEAKSDLRHPKEQKVILLNFMGPDGPDDPDFATTLDHEPLRFHRRLEETAEMFQERVCDELRIRDEHNARNRAGDHISMQFRKGRPSIGLATWPITTSGRSLSAAPDARTILLHAEKLCSCAAAGLGNRS